MRLGAWHFHYWHFYGKWLPALTMKFLMYSRENVWEFIQERFLWSVMGER